MNWVKKHKFEVIIFILISALYFIIRIPSLTLQPVFADEAIYIRWAQVMRADPTLRFISVSDGKTPLFMWAMIPLLKVFKDPLFAGRILSVFAGFFTLIGAFYLGLKFFNSKVGLIAALFVTVTPFIYFYDRLALVDSMLSAFSLWSLILGLLLIRYSRLDLAMILGYALGGGLLTKTPGMFNFLSMVATLFTFDFSSQGREKRLLKIFGLFLVAGIIAFVMYNILRLGPNFSSLNSRDQDYVRDPISVLSHPLNPLVPHLGDVWEWFLKLVSLPTTILILIGITFSVIKKNKYGLALFIWSFIPMLVQAMFLQTFTSRYFLFSIPPLLILAAYGMYELDLSKRLNRKVVLSLLIILVLIWPSFFIFKLLTNPADAPLPNNDHAGFFEQWTAGYGNKEVADYLIAQAKSQTVVVGTEGSFGTLPDGLEIYVENYNKLADPKHQVIVIPQGLNGNYATISVGLRTTAKDHPTYFVANHSRFPGAANLQLINQYPKAPDVNGVQDALLFYRVLP